MNDEDLRDCFAMFAMNGLIIFRNGVANAKAVAEDAYLIADQMIEARKPQEDEGIVAIKKRRYERKTVRA